jgi:acyl dehydratase
MGIHARKRWNAVPMASFPLPLEGEGAGGGEGIEERMAVIEFDRSVLGKEFVLGTYQVTAEMIEAFSRAVGETNPLYVDAEAAQKGPAGGLIAPPIFYDVFRADQIPDPKVKFGKVGFNAGQRCEFYVPIRPGDTITMKTRVTDVYEKTGRTGKMVFIVRETTYENQTGEKVAMVEQSQVRRESGAARE